jgi:hypothetical protein
MTLVVVSAVECADGNGRFCRAVLPVNAPLAPLLWMPACRNGLYGTHWFNPIGLATVPHCATPLLLMNDGPTRRTQRGQVEVAGAGLDQLVVVQVADIPVEQAVGELEAAFQAAAEAEGGQLGAGVARYFRSTTPPVGDVSTQRIALLAEIGEPKASAPYG